LASNFSCRILAWRVADTIAPVNSVAVLVEASRGATHTETMPVVLADACVENVNVQIDDLITTGVLRRVLAFTDLKFSNSMIEAWCRSLKHKMALSSLARQRSHGASIGREAVLTDILHFPALLPSSGSHVTGESFPQSQRHVGEPR
jgi:hypothetical protein